MQVKSLGTVSSVARGIVTSAGTNATPIVLTLTAGHELKNGDRIAIAGVTGNTGMNGEWTVTNVGATAATLAGSAGNGASGGTIVTAAVCDKTPFLPRNTAALVVSGAFTGTLLVEGADDVVKVVDVPTFHYTDSAGLAVAGFRDVTTGTGQAAIPALAGGGIVREVRLMKYMTLRASAASGAANAALLA